MIRRTLLILLALTATAEACGPDFFPDVFVRTGRPDLPAQYAAGHLGILHTDFPPADLFVAYRYLSGGALSPAEQKQWSPTDSAPEQDLGNPPIRSLDEQTAANSAVAAWSDTRARFTTVSLADIDPTLQKKVASPGGYSYNVTVPNCADDAFRTATATLQARAAAWGKSSPSLTDWIAAQDAVFGNCDKEAVVPKPAPAGSPLLLQQDRAYQVAAAEFYAGHLDVASNGFAAVAADRASPWLDTAAYLRGRIQLRQALAVPTTTAAPAGFDRAALAAAGRAIDSYLGTKPPARWARAAEMQRNLIRIRLEPDVRIRELASAVAGPREDWNYGQDVQDILWFFRKSIPDGFRAEISPWEQVTAQSPNLRSLTPAQSEAAAGKTRDAAFEQTASLRNAAPILDWILTLRSLAPAAAPHALRMWQQTPTLPWLVAALTLAPDNAPAADLVEAAASIPPTSPAYQAVAWHRARLQLAAGNAAAAQATLAALQASLEAESEKQREPSTRNAIRSLASRASADTSGLLQHLSQTVLEAESESALAARDCAEVRENKGDWHHCLKPGTEDLDVSAARLLNEHAPLTLWIAAARSSTVPQPLRSAIAMQGWARATLLGNTAAAESLQTLLPAPLQTELAARSTLTPWVALTRNPGLQPDLDPGTQRAYAYDFVENYRLNWCYNSVQHPQPQPPAAALSPQDRRQGEAEAAKIKPLRSVDVGEKLIAAVAAHPNDPAAPEALYLVLRMIRYGCNPVHEPGQDRAWGSLPDPGTGDRLLQLRRDTAALMRRYFKASPWTKKAAPFVGEVHPPAKL